VVVNFAIEDDADRAVGGPHGLAAAGEIDDGEAAVAEVDGGLFVNPMAVGIGAAMRDGARHALEIGALAAAHESGYSAHEKELGNVEIRKAGRALTRESFS
jgi:hypothetical protein